MSNERWQGEELFQSKNHVLEMPPSHAKTRLKSAPQKLNILMAKAIQKLIHWIVATNALARFRIVTQCYATSFLRKTILCETNNIFYSLGNQIWHKTNDIFWKYIKNKDEVTLDSFRNFAYVSSHLHLKSFAWKRDYVIS